MASRTRTIAALTGGAVLFPLLLLAVPAHAAGESTPPPAQPESAFCQVPAGYQPFTDISGNSFEQTIECLAFAEITRGGPGGMNSDRYGPRLEVTRDAMASFVARLIDKADELDSGSSIRTLPPFDGRNDFTDVAGNVHADNIDRLAEAGIVRGGPAGRPVDSYGPTDGVSRAQMASFVQRALQYMTGDSFRAPDDYFTDDESAQPHEPNINVLAAEGIAIGDGANSYQPAVTVRRDQMSGFLIRSLAVLEADGDLRPLG